MQRRLESRGDRPWIMPYLTAGYPAVGETVDLLLALEEGGADAIELGLPFSDPLADGPVIQATSQKALEGGTTHRAILDLVRAFRARSEVPLILMGYMNPILAYGPDRFFVDAASAGADGLIVPDLPPEEADPYHAAAQEAGLDWIFLAAPTSSDARLRAVDARSTRLNYCVSVTGVTGARDAFPTELTGYLERAARAFRKPFVVGFGIASADHVRHVVPPAAGVVVGSALLRELGKGRDAADRRTRATAFVRRLRP